MLSRDGGEQRHGRTYQRESDHVVRLPWTSTTRADGPLEDDGRKYDYIPSSTPTSRQHSN